MRYVFIANPKAGAGKGFNKYKDRLVTACEKMGVPYKFMLTRSGSDLTDFARSEGEKGDEVRIIVLGGDGGICGAANGIICMENVEFGIIPCGSGNDYVKSFGGAKGFEDIEHYLTAPSRYVDAIDTVTGKIELVMKAERSGTPIISAMGAGNKLDPTMFEVADIFSTSVCPLARVMRSELKKRGIRKLKVVYSKEKPITPEKTSDPYRRQIPGSVSFVPSVAGLIIAGEVIKDICKEG